MVYSSQLFSLIESDPLIDKFICYSYPVSLIAKFAHYSRNRHYLFTVGNNDLNSSDNYEGSPVVLNIKQYTTQFRAYHALCIFATDIDFMYV